LIIRLNFFGASLIMSAKADGNLINAFRVKKENTEKKILPARFTFMYNNS